MVRRILTAILLASVFALATTAVWAGAPTPKDPAPVSQAQRAIDNGLRWLRSAQKPDGTWGGHLGITELAVMAFARSHRAYREEDGPFMRLAIVKIRNAAKPDGSITEGSGNESTKNYTTALGVLALASLNDPKDKELIQKAQDWLKRQQTDEANGYTPDNKFYGGFGYGSSLRPDLSNTQFAIEALRASGLPANDAVFAKAVKFISRVQNRTESNDVPGALDDGGFAYYPGYSFEGGWTSTGSMTYAGMKSYIYADMDKNDPRVQAALKWITKNYTVDEHPGRGSKTYYYYIDVFARTWHIMKTDVVVTDDGTKHDWFKEMVTKLVAEQRPEGYWVNSRSADEWEDRPELCTAHALLALIYGMDAYTGKN
ncbi:MAG TPA: prenyltransferase/squalene oxidase repeat-containing protein [Candidatus Baltobacteraceae bacterium]|nr:prenyltransferase/squalene oxidase repeat-containing protein [Candidatus Baltobacteraceae bacterium]